MVKLSFSVELIITCQSLRTLSVLCGFAGIGVCFVYASLGFALGCLRRCGVYCLYSALHMCSWAHSRRVTELYALNPLLLVSRPFALNAVELLEAICFSEKTLHCIS